MAALPTTRLTYGDLAKLMDPDGIARPVVELLSQRGMKELMTYLHWMPGNLPTGHQWSVRTALPTASLRDYNEFVLPTKSASAQLTAGMSMITAFSEIDRKEAKLNGNEARFRAIEDVAFIQALEQEFMRLFIYGDSKKSAKEFNGLAAWYPTKTSANVLDAGGSGTDNMSIYLGNFSEDGIFGTYPKGSEAGIQTEDLPRTLLQASDGSRMVADVREYCWQCGIVAKDYRRAVRICNIDVSDLKARTGTQAITAATSIIYLMSDALQMLPDGGGQRAFLANRTAIAALAKIGMDKSQNVLDVQTGLTQFGKPFQKVTFLGTEVVPFDRLINAEAVI